MKAMNRTITILAVGLALTLGLLLCTLTGPAASAQPYRHNLRVNRALDALREARIELKEAPHDYHGHRREALEAVDRAIEQLDKIKDIER